MARQQIVGGHTVPLPSIMSTLYLISPTNWFLKSHLLAFEQTIVRHTGNSVGHDIVKILDKFEMADKVCTFVLLFFNTMTDTAWLAACPGHNNVTVNDNQFVMSARCLTNWELVDP